MNPFNPTPRRRFLLPLTSVCALCVGLANPAFGQDAQENAGGQEPPSDEPVVNVTDYDTVDLAVQDADLAQVLQMLSLQSRKNIITSRNVSATVTANLYDVTFYEALDAILTVNGFTWVEDGNFIYVYTQEEYDQIQEAQRERVSRIFELDNLAATDAIEFITPLLSERGTASARGEVNAGFQPTISDGGADDYAFSPKIVVYDYPENVERIASTLKELDTPPKQVLVESTILQTSVDESNAFGIDFSVIGGMDFLNVMNPLSTVTGLLQGDDAENGFQPGDNNAQAAQSTVGGTAGPGGLKIGVVSNDVSVFLRALDEVSDTTVLARPKIMALNRQSAEVLVGARIGFLSTTATETTTTQTVEFLDTGIQLVLRPFITNDGMIRMELRPSVSEASLRTVTDSVGAQVTIPDEITNELTTNVRVRDGETLILGGLFRESTTVTRRQVPLLGDIPVLGTAFRGQDDSVARQEIIFLITPSIIQDEVLWENGEEALAFAEMVRIGAREGLLPFSREKMTNSHNMHAIAAAKAGDTELALYHVRNSLRLNPSQPNVIHMREQLTGDKDHAYERSMFERIVNEKIEHKLTIDSVSYSKADPKQDEPAQQGAQKNPLVKVYQISDPANESASNALEHASDDANEEGSATDAPAPEEQTSASSADQRSAPAEGHADEAPSGEVDYRYIETLDDAAFEEASSPLENPADSATGGDTADAADATEGTNDAAQNDGRPVQSPLESDDDFSQTKPAFWDAMFSSVDGGWWFGPEGHFFRSDYWSQPGLTEDTSNDNAIAEVDSSDDFK